MIDDHPFELNERYENPTFGEYEVVAFEDEKMLVQFEDGQEKWLTVATQARIWRNAQFDEETASAFEQAAKQRRETEVGVTQPIKVLVDDVLRELPTPYPADVVELVCMAIEQNEAFMQRYNDLVVLFSQRSQYGKDIVNNWIGKYTSQLTSKRAVKQVPATRTMLISSYSMLK